MRAGWARVFRALVRPWLLVVALAACVTTWTPPIPQSYHRTQPVSEATELVGAEECEVCHEEVAGYAPAPDYHANCEACHGFGDLHTDSEEVSEIRYPSNRDCLACHESGRSTHLAWTTSEHERSGVLCSDCHSGHNREPSMLRVATPVQTAVLPHASDTSRLCASCHTEVAARLGLPSHHPVREGMLDCTDCHKPHESSRFALGARTSQCTSCHQDYAGPWIYEHAPVTEDCGYCHSAHGSHAANLLETNQPGSCISCHSIPTMGATHDPEAFSTRCTDCHSAVHGSYADPNLRR